MWYIHLWSFKSVTWIVLNLMLWTRKNYKREVSQILWSRQFLFLCTALHFSTKWSIHLWSFKSVVWIVFNFCLGQDNVDRRSYRETCDQNGIKGPFLLLLIFLLLILKVIGLHHLYRARPTCTSVQSGQLADQLEVFILISLKW